jgi:hypothetical protein
MSLPKVNINITDGGLGLITTSAVGKQAKVGVCSVGALNSIIILTDRDQVADALGTGPLADACYDAFAAGASLIYAVRATSDVDGTIGTITKSGTGTGSLSASGTPLDAYDVIVKIITGGNLNEGVFQYSLDGGDTYSAKLTIPTTGTYVIPDTGITLTFTTGTGTSFIAGDTFTFTVTAPGASVSSIQTAVDVLLNSSYIYEWIHVVGPTAQSLWVALDTLAQEAEADYRYIHFIAECRGPESGETVDEWVSAVVALRNDFASARVSVVAGRLEITDAKTGRLVDRNGAGIYTGRLSTLDVQSSPGKVIEGALPSINQLNPSGITEGHIDTLDDAGFVTFTQHIGLEGFYITNGRMMAESISDYQYVELRRVMDKLCRNIHIKALRFLNAEADQKGIKALEAYLQAPVTQMVKDGELTSGKVIIPEDQDILTTSKVKVKIRCVPVPIMRTIEIDIGYTTES